MNKEFEFLNIISKTLDNSSYLGDDCAYLDEYKLAISQDSLIEDVHFSLRYMNANEIAKKALLVNISDILASGALPKYCSISLSGKLDSNFVKEFYLGINEICKEYNLKVLGGDLTKSDKITISITIFGDYKNRLVSSRKNAKNDYIVAVSGEFGSSAQGLEDLERGIKDNYFIKCHKYPKLYNNVALEISSKVNNPYAMMDSSDGLVDCLVQMSEKSKVRIDVNYQDIPKKVDDKNKVLFGGEDYCLVMCLKKEDFDKIQGLYKIGKCSFGKGVSIDNQLIDYRGYNHFE